MHTFWINFINIQILKKSKYSDSNCFTTNLFNYIQFSITIIKLISKNSQNLDFFRIKNMIKILKTKSTNVTNTICDKKNHNDSRLKKTKMTWYYCQTNTLISILYISLTIFFKRSYSIIVCWFIRKISLHKTKMKIWFHRCVLFNAI